MKCSYCVENIIHDLKKALKSEDLEKEVKKIIKKYNTTDTGGKGKKGDYYVRAGEAYLISEDRANLANIIFEQVLKRKYRGLYITRTKPENLEFYSLLPNTEFYWISSIRGENTVSPSDLPKMLAIIKEFLKEDQRGVIMLDGADSLIINNGFNKFLKFIQNAKDAVSEHHGILLVPINMKARDEKEKALLENELMEISKKK